MNVTIHDQDSVPERRDPTNAPRILAKRLIAGKKIGASEVLQILNNTTFRGQVIAECATLERRQAKIDLVVRLLDEHGLEDDPTLARIIVDRLS